MPKQLISEHRAGSSAPLALGRMYATERDRATRSPVSRPSDGGACGRVRARRQRNDMAAGGWRHDRRSLRCVRALVHARVASTECNAWIIKQHTRAAAIVAAVPVVRCSLIGAAIYTRSLYDRRLRPMFLFNCYQSTVTKLYTAENNNIRSLLKEKMNRKAIFLFVKKVYFEAGIIWYIFSLS